MAKDSLNAYVILVNFFVLEITKAFIFANLRLKLYVIIV